MKLVEVFQITKKGWVLITNKKIPETDWSSHSNTERIRVFDTNESKEFEVKEVTLILKNGTDYLSYLIKEDLDASTANRRKKRMVEPVGPYNSGQALRA
ncbi:hypothetical protein [Pelagicoccus sp. SDUM812003]|uniref:hypothetical protein n=1 Tax=Pelagicoccus sp. SDUM812003 TaxID=3041267 RepID=UPI00280D27BE|nr:hypothetical protein [Pelagicoccus sp. SDUM812003]MDQ8205844.1 hypothetical protein [Pelagicoccus sp. SDUM812003]